MISPSSLSAFSVLRPAIPTAAPATGANPRSVQVADAAGAQPMAPVGQRPAQPDPTARRGSLLDRMA
nr:hypothetical protein [uncultured Lichenicoccus sp.]